MEKIICFFEKLVHTFYGIIKIFIGLKFRTKINVQKRKGESCYILGNGPSLNGELDEYYLRLKSENLIVVNQFGCTKYYSQLKPGFYILVDPGYYVDSLDQNTRMTVNNLFEELKEKTSWPIKIFVPLKGQKRVQELLKENRYITVVGYNSLNTWKGFKWFDRWVYDNQWAILSGLNVVMVALYLAITIGFQKIYLLGVDHSWHKNIVVGSDNMIYTYDFHFYDDENLKLTPIFIEENNRMRYLKLHEQLGYIKKVFEVYHYIQDYAEYKNVEIFNCTSNSFIDAFKRIKL